MPAAAGRSMSAAAAASTAATVTGRSGIYAVPHREQSRDGKDGRCNHLPFHVNNSRL
jgi:hypothetical protein